MPPEHSFRFFRNVDCEYFPCHQGAAPETFNCLFCYCPLYFLSDCGGKPQLRGGIKDCSACTVPHAEDGYEHVLNRLKAHFAAQRPCARKSTSDQP